MFREVTPREVFILPKDNATVTITATPDVSRHKDSRENHKEEYHYKIFGFLRISPGDKFVPSAS